MKFSSLTITLAASFLFLSIAILAINGSLNIYFDYRTQQKDISKSLQLIAENASDEVDGFINKKYSILESAARFVQMDDRKQKLKLVLDKLLGLEPSFRKLAILDSRKQELARSSRLAEYMAPPLTSQADKNLFAILKAKQRYISKIFIDQITYEPIVLMSVPVTDFFGNYQGVLIAETNLKFMWDMVADIKVGNHGQAYVIDNEGYLIAFEDIGRVLKRERPIALEEVKKAISDRKLNDGKNLEISRGINKTRVISTHRHLDNLDCSIVVELPAWEAYASVMLVIRLTLVSMMLTLAIAVIIGFYLSKRITRPIIGLRNAIGKVGMGDLEATIEIQSSNEIGEVADGFNRMVDNLKKTTVSRDQLIEEIIQREKIESDLKEAKKAAEVASEVKSRFLANMSHEIRTPMNAIVGFSELLKRSSLDETQSGYLASIHESADNLLSIINDILDLSKIEADKLQFENIEFNFPHLIESVFNMVRSKFLKKNVDLVHTIEKGTPVDFKGDPTRIRQIFINLIGNAIKFTEQGEIVVNLGLDVTDNHETSRNSGFCMLRVSVRDTGIGIQDDKKEEIFESFNQADTSTTRHYGGTGLGLAITKAFVEKMGGRIWVNSEYGKGSEFIFLLRLEQAKAVRDVSTGPANFESLDSKNILMADNNSDMEFKGMNVLIAEDNKINMALIRELLIKFGAVTDQAINGKEALEKLKSNLYDIILMDVHMPVMNGLEATRFIRKEISPTIPIIALTASAMLEDREKALCAGMNDFISKPIDVTLLKDVLRKYYSK